MGDVNDFSNFMNAVIDEASFDNISSYIDYAKNSSEAEIISGGGYDKTKGYFIEPTTILTTNAYFKTMEEEIFGPVLTIYLYNESWDDICAIVDVTSPYSLTGAIFAQDKKAVDSGRKMLSQCFPNLLGISTSMISPLVQLWVNSHLGEAGHREQMIRPDHH